MKVVFADTGYWEAVLNPKDYLNAIKLDAGAAGHEFVLAQNN